jgi:hypothetical protein
MNLITKPLECPLLLDKFYGEAQLFFANNQQLIDLVASWLPAELLKSLTERPAAQEEVPVRLSQSSKLSDEEQKVIQQFLQVKKGDWKRKMNYSVREILKPILFRKRRNKKKKIIKFGGSLQV